MIDRDRPPEPPRLPELPPGPQQPTPIQYRLTWLYLCIMAALTFLAVIFEWKW